MIVFDLVEIYFQRCDWKKGSIGSGKVFVPNRPQAISLANADKLHIAMN